MGTNSGRTRRRVAMAAATAVITVATTVAVTSSAPAQSGAGGVGNRAWIDTNGNGRVDAGEQGAAGVRLTLARVGGPGSFTGVTGEGGWWGLRNLPVGACYRLSYTIPAGHTASPLQIAGVATQSTIGADGVVPTTICATAAPQDQWDAGFVPTVQPPPPPAGTGSIAGRVMLDANDDSSSVPSTPADRGFGGIAVRISDATGRVRFVGTTPADGRFRFSGIPSNQCYTVSIEIPSDHRPSSRTLLADGLYDAPVCVTTSTPNASTETMLLAAKRAMPLPVPSGASTYRFRNQTGFFESESFARVDVDGGRPRLVVDLVARRQHRSDGTIVAAPELEGWSLNLRAPVGLARLEPGVYTAVPNDRSAAISSGPVSTTTGGCVNARVTANVIRIAYDAAGAVSQLEMSFDDPCRRAEGLAVVGAGTRLAATDADGDAVADTADNCLGVGNPSQADRDADGLGDSCDAEITVSKLTVTSPPGEPAFKGRSFEVTPSTGTVTVRVEPADTPLIDVTGRALVDFEVVITERHLVERPFDDLAATTITLRFRRGESILGTFTGAGASARVDIARTVHGTTRSACDGSATVGTGNMTVHQIGFGFMATPVTWLDASFTRACNDGRPAAIGRVQIGLPI